MTGMRAFENLHTDSSAYKSFFFLVCIKIILLVYSKVKPPTTGVYFITEVRLYECSVVL